MPRKLTVVTGDAPPSSSESQKAPSSLKEAIDCSELDLLIAMRRRVAGEIDAGPPAHALAQLMRQLRELDKEIRGIKARTEEEPSRGASGHPGDAAFDASAV